MALTPAYYAAGGVADTPLVNDLFGSMAAGWWLGGTLRAG